MISICRKCNRILRGYSALSPSEKKMIEGVNRNFKIDGFGACMCKDRDNGILRIEKVITELTSEKETITIQWIET